MSSARYSLLPCEEFNYEYSEGHNCQQQQHEHNHSSKVASHTGDEGSASSHHPYPSTTSPRHLHTSHKQAMLCVRCVSARQVACALLLGCVLLLMMLGPPWTDSLAPDVTRVWSVVHTRNLSVYVRPREPTTLLAPLEPCVGSELLVVVVPSSPGHAKQRDSIRNTWGQWLNGVKYRAPHKARSLLLYEVADTVVADTVVADAAAVDAGTFHDAAAAVAAMVNVRNKRASSEKEDNRKKIESTLIEKLKLERNKSSILRSQYAQIDPSLKFKLVFLLGHRAKYDGPGAVVLKEQDRHGDLIVEDFVDSYQNLTLKSVFMLKYMRDFCPTAKFVAKVDDDMFLHVPNLQNTLLEASLPSKLMLGCLFCNARPITNPWNKWYSPSYMYRGDKYPNYLSGTSYVISGNLVTPLLDAAMVTPLFHLEDVFITGILPRKLGLRLTDNIGFSYQARPLNPCLYQNVTVGHKVEPDHMMKLWNLLHLTGVVKQCRPLSSTQIRKYTPTNCVWR